MNDLTRSALNIENLRFLSRRRLTKALFEFCDRGSEDEVQMRDIRAALDAIKLVPRVLQDVSGLDPSHTLFGKEHGFPLVISPTAPPAGCGTAARPPWRVRLPLRTSRSLWPAIRTRPWSTCSPVAAAVS